MLARVRLRLVNWPRPSAFRSPDQGWIVGQAMTSGKNRQVRTTAGLVPQGMGSMPIQRDRLMPGQPCCVPGRQSGLPPSRSAVAPLGSSGLPWRGLSVSATMRGQDGSFLGGSPAGLQPSLAGASGTLARRVESRENPHPALCFESLGPANRGSCQPIGRPTILTLLHPLRICSYALGFRE